VAASSILSVNVTLVALGHGFASAVYLVHSLMTLQCIARIVLVEVLVGNLSTG
jgi:hypothetical protein